MNADAPPPIEEQEPAAGQPVAGNSNGSTRPAHQSATANLSAASRQRLQQVFQHANKSLDKGDYDYAHDMYTQCVSEDPSTLAYLQHFRANLTQMYVKSGKKSGGFGFGRGGGRSGFTKAAGKGDWTAAFVLACNTLKKNPGDTATLCDMANGCGELGYTDCQLYYLKWAHDISPNDHQINRLSALALEAISQFDQAINCWLRIQKLKPGDEEAAKSISRLSVEKTIDDGGYNPALLSGKEKDVVVDRPGRVAGLSIRELNADSGDQQSDQQANVLGTPATGGGPEDSKKLTAREQEDMLRQAIDQSPKEVAPYLALADYYAGLKRLLDSERLYRKALAVDGTNDLAILEKLEEIYLLRMTERAIEAGRRLAKHPSDEAEKTAETTVAEANRAEIEVFTARSTRNPKDLKLKYELGLRYKRVGSYREAIEPLQAAREDSKRQSEVNLLLGECFQQIGQHLLALRSYEASIAVFAEGDWTDLRKLATYRAGVLALGMKELDRAESHLTDLAGADFSYRDVGERLDKIAKIRDAT